VTPSPNYPINVEVSINGMDIDQNNVYKQPDKSARAIFVSNAIQDEDLEPTKDTDIVVKITGLRNPFTNETTDSFEIQTFNFMDG